MGTINTNLKAYKFIIGFCLFIVGVLFFTSLQSSIRYLGIVLMLGAIIYLSIVFSGFFVQSDKEKFKSPTREQILKRQQRK
jgi:hypothetical protein